MTVADICGRRPHRRRPRAGTLDSRRGARRMEPRPEAGPSLALRGRRRTAQVPDRHDQAGEQHGRGGEDQGADQPGGPAGAPRARTSHHGRRCIEPPAAIRRCPLSRPTASLRSSSDTSRPGDPERDPPQDQGRDGEDDRRSDGRSEQTPGSASRHRRNVKRATRRKRGFPPSEPHVAGKRVARSGYFSLKARMRSLNAALSRA